MVSVFSTDVGETSNFFGKGISGKFSSTGRRECAFISPDVYGRIGAAGIEETEIKLVERRKIEPARSNIRAAPNLS